MKVLDPIERVSEIVFGLLMAQAITGSLSIAGAGQEDVRTMLVAALGCNIAWGLVDGIMYLVSTLTERTRKATLMRRLRETPEAARAHALIAEELPERLGAVAAPALLEALRDHLKALPVAAIDARLRREDYGGAVGVFFLVVLSTFPVVIPFMLVDELKLAMRLSNLVAFVTLFAGGWMLARYAGGSSWKGGLTLAAIGAALSAAIIALGG